MIPVADKEAEAQGRWVVCPGSQRLMRDPGGSQLLRCVPLHENVCMTFSDILNVFDWVLFLVVSPTLHQCHRYPEAVMQCVSNLLPNQTWIHWPTHSKSSLQTPGCGEGKNSIYCRRQARRMGSLCSKDMSSSMVFQEGF